MSENNIIIDNQKYVFQPGQTILEVAEENGIHIPTLCYLKGATPTGACRICVVEVEGAKALVASCSTPAAPNMVVKTSSPRVIRARKFNIELLLSSGHHNCLAQDLDNDSWTDAQLEALSAKGHEDLCPAYGRCKLQDLAIEYRVRTNHFQPSEQRYAIEDASPLIVRDFSRCILCGRCVQACNEVQVNRAISFGYRGSSAKVVTKGDRPLSESDCVFCGECVQACPVGALFIKGEISSGDLDPGIKKVRTTCSYCGVGCQLYLHVKENKVIRVTGVENVGPNFGSLCVKGRFGYNFINDQKRLTRPLIRENNEFREATWDEALNLIAKRLIDIKDDHGPDSIGVFSSARITNEENYLAQKFTRAVIGTNNIDHCARLCHASTIAGLSASFGSGAMTNPIEDVEKADVILITGSNTTENHPVLSSYVKRAVTYRGTKLIVVDPRKIPITDFATFWLRQNLGTDVAWLNGMMHVIIKERLYDEKYVNSRTVGLDELKKTVEKYTPEYVEGITGIPKDLLVKAARMYAQAKAASIIYSMGITQHTTGTDNVKSVANLSMLCGNVGIEGGGVNPLRGQNNVQGACDMGALPNVYTGYQKVDDHAIRDKMERAWGVKGLPAAPGLSVTQMIEKAHEGGVKAIYIIGENPMLSDPDLNHVKKSLEKLEFLVVQDIFLTETAELADVVLPSASFAEKSGTFTNTERRVQLVRKAVAPPGKAKEDMEIICALSGRMGYPMAYNDSGAVMEEIAKLTPSYCGINHGRLEHEGIHWPCPAKDHPGTPCLHIDKFTCGLGVFHGIDYAPPAEIPDKEYPLFLTTGRVLYQYHTGTMTMKSQGLNDLAPNSFVEISKRDADGIGIKDEDMLRITSRRGEIKAKARISEKAVDGTVFMPFHYAEGAANILTNRALDPVAMIPEYKVCAVRLGKL
ncbi:MAG: formate dehydrogenase subunit alpha [Deltaproteobacteria bacterium]|nr:formate dehydrogenase subunit alpha [Deltaproteobacteria bacterium]